MKDVMGQELTESESAVLATYRDLKLLVRRADLAPCASANLRQALAHASIAVTDLGLAFEHLLEDEV